MVKGKGKAKRSKSGPSEMVEDEIQNVTETLHKTAILPQSSSEAAASGSAGNGGIGSSNTATGDEKTPQRQAQHMGNLDFIEIQSTETKGQAVFASRKIKPGTLLFCETPLIRLTQAEEDEDKASANTSSILEDHFKELPRATQKAYLKLYDSEKADFSRIKSIYYSNCYNLSDANRPSKDSPGGSAIGITASRINHSCLPNVQFSFDEHTNQMLFHAIKPIPKGREIVSNYNSIFELRGARHRKQMLYYGFRCDCEACEAKTDFWARSDERRKGMIEARKEVKSCDKSFEEHSRVTAENDALFALERLEALCVKEGIVGLPLADVYRSLAKWAERKGDRKDARSWKSKELNVCRICLGERSPRVKLVEAKIQAFA